MTSEEIRKRFLDFFEKKGHKIIPSASLVPENDPSVLFNTAGMQPLVPYLLGEKHPAGTRLANIQKCVRTGDIDDIGDNTHLTFFEMMGNWSLGDYFKDESIRWSFELLTNKEEGYSIDPSRLYVTCFEGDENAPKDEESFGIWKSVGIPENRIYFMGAKDNWWSPGDNGPCGPDTEIFYDLTEKGLGDLSKEDFIKARDDDQTIVEIWNNVFMEYEKKDGKVVGKLSQKNVDTGAGFERFVMALQGKNNVFDIDLFAPLMDAIRKETNSEDIKAIRIIADHIRTATFMIADGVLPSNTDSGYVLRRLIRRAKYYYDSIGVNKTLGYLVHKVADMYKNTGYNLSINEIDKVVTDEELRFSATLEYGKKLFEKMLKNKGMISGEDVFLLYSTYGYPFELIKEIAKENDISIDEDDFNERLRKHQELSRAGAEQKFKGGLAGHGEKELQYHTATHLLHQALREVLGDSVGQKGSNITAERLRFDFSHPEKMTDEQKKKVEDIVNQKIQEALPVQKVIMPIEEARKTGAIHFFNEKYGDDVSIYFVGNNLEAAFSKEFCGGPHVTNTSELKGVFKIKKEEAVSAGVRRIKAVLD